MEWVFDELPPSGARQGGDPSKYAFEHDFETFVREVLQNSNDQAIAPVEVTFRFTLLDGADLEDYKRNILWEGVESHLSAVANTDQGRAIRNFLREFRETGELLLLTIEDRNTTGLEGAESGEDSNFTALCKDKLYSYKGDESAGGSYGLGKSVLWKYSGLSTVLFNSTLRTDPDGKQSPRFIGQAQLPTHEIDDETQAYDGAGWLGEPVPADGGERAESVWSAQATEFAESVYLGRGETTGTSVQIVGFKDPTADENWGPEQYGEKIREAAGRYFWPAMTGTSRLTVNVHTSNEEKQVSIDGRSDVEPFVECYQQRSSAVDELEYPGDVTTHEIEVEIPDKRDGTPTKSGPVTLSVRLADEDADDELCNNVAVFRSAGMVVDYWTKNRLSIGARPFHASLICGRARNPGEPTQADEDIEEFLRTAEPPAHNDWDSTETLKETYKRGYLKAINELKDDVTDTLRELVTPSPKSGKRGPDKLRRRFPMGRRTSESSTKRGTVPFSFRRPQATFVGDKWTFSGIIEPSESGHDGWTAAIELTAVGEDGTRLDRLPIESLSLDSTRAIVDIVDGEAQIVAEPGVNETDFDGESSSIGRDGSVAHSAVGEIALDISGELYGGEE